MEYTIERLTDSPVICATLKGRFDLEACLNVAGQARSQAAEHWCNVLYDVRSAQFDLSTSDQYDWPSRVAALDLGTPDKLAILSTERGRMVSFIETCAQNASQNVRVFTDHDQAVAWLSTDGS